MAIDLKTSRDQRISKARALVDSGSFVRSAGAVMIFSDCPTVVGGGWTVSEGQCGCPDATLGAAARLLSGRCKHVVAAEFVELLAERDAAPVPVTPRRLAPRAEDAERDEWDRAAAARRLERIASEFAS